MAMKKFINDADNLVKDLLEGFALAHADKVSVTENGLVVRATPKAQDKVALVTLGVLIFLTLADTMTRGDIDQEERGPINRRAAMYQQDTTAVPAADINMTGGQTNDTTASEDTSHAP